MLRILILPLCLAACAYGTQELGGTENSVSYRAGPHAPSPIKRATAHCAKYGKKPELVGATIPSEQGVVYRYRCV